MEVGSTCLLSQKRTTRRLHAPILGSFVETQISEEANSWKSRFLT
jgi:hypothetical protein